MVICCIDPLRNMLNRNATISLVAVCLAVILVAGCTSSTTNNNAAPNQGSTAPPPQTSTPVQVTAVASPQSTVAGSQDPIVGTWSYTAPQGGTLQVVFGADGSFSGSLNGQVERSGTWQDIGGGKYSVTVTGQAAPVNWVYNANTAMAYNSAYPSMGYSRARSG
jgi:hypothetical protein